MTLSGTYTKGFTNNGSFRLRIAWSAIQNVNENYSRVTANLYIDSLQSWASVYDGTSSPCSISINGNTKSFSNTSTIDGWGSKLLGSHTVNVYHNNDGSKWFEIYATHNFDITWNGSYVGTVDVYGSDWLNTIPRASVPTITTTGIKYGDNIHVNLNRASEDFTHYVSIDIGDVLTNIGEMDEYTNAFDFILPLEWCSRIPNMSSNMGKFNVHTYNGDGTYIGSNEVWFTAAVPASVVPTIDSVSIAEAVAGLAEKFGVYVQSKSKLALGVTGSGAYGSTISAYKITANGVTYNTQSASTAELLTSGNLNIVFMVSDSRGRSTSRTEVINVVPYAAPSTASITAERALVTGEPDDDGTYTNVTVVGTIAPVNNMNDKTYTIRHRQVGAEPWIETTLDNSSYALSLTQIVSGFDVDFAYEIELVVADYFSSDSIQTEVSTAFTLVDYFAGGKGIAFGKVANKNGMEIALSTGFLVAPTIFAPTSDTEDAELMYLRRDNGTLLAFIGTGAGGMGLNINLYDGTNWTGTLSISENGDIYTTGKIKTDGSIESGGYVSKEIPVGSDLNNYTIVGMYSCNTNAVAATIANTAGAAAFSLLVERHAGVKQTFTRYETGNPATYIRNYYDGTWGAWHQVAFI